MRLSRAISLLSVVFALTVAQARAEVTWGEDFPAALKEGAKDNKLVLLNFTGSTWCPPCMMIEKKVLSTEEFAAFAGKNLVLVRVDFPSPGELAPGKYFDQNEKLAERFQLEGVPTFILLDAKGKPVAKEVGLFTQTPEGFIDWVKKAQAKAAK